MSQYRVTFTYYRGPGWWGDDVIKSGSNINAALNVFDDWALTAFGPDKFKVLSIEVLASKQAPATINLDIS